VVIAAGHTITVSDTRSIDQLTVSGNLTINNGFVLTIADGTGTDLTVNATGVVTNNGTLTLAFDPPPPPIFNATAVINGTLNNSGTITNAAPARLSFGANSVYNHQHTTVAGVIPSATWNATSTCQVTGYTSNAAAPTGLNQTFGHFTWNTPLLENYINLAGVLTTVTGNLTITNVPSTYIALTESTNYNLVVGGNLTISDSYISANASGTVSIQVAGSTTFSNNNDLTMVFDGSTTLDCNGSLTIDGGTNNLTYDGPGNLIITTTGDFSLLNAPAINNAGSGTYTLTFDGLAASPQAFTASQALTGFSYVIQNGSQVNVGSGSAFIGTGAFTLQGGATLGVGSVNGLTTGTTQGAVRVTGTRTYTTGSNIIYNGSVGQSLGTEWGTSGALNGIAVNLEIANTSVQGVTNSAVGGTSLVGRLRLTQGSLNIGTSNVLVISGDFEAFSSPTRTGTIGGSSSSDLQIIGSGSMTGTLNFTTSANTLKNFAIGRNTDITLGTDLTIATGGVLSFTASGNLIINGLTLTVNGNITQAAAGAISSSVNTSNIIIGGTGALTTFPLASGSLFNNITFSRTSGSYTWGSNATISGILDLTSGTLTRSSSITMGTGSTFRRSAGTTYVGTVPDAVTRYSVSYLGTLTTSSELPATGDNFLENLTTSGDVTLDKDIIINGNLNINSGTLLAGSHNISMLGATFAINGGTFSMNTGSTLTFGRVGSATLMSGSSINNSQYGNFTIAASASVTAPNANIIINGSWDNSGTFTPGTGTVTFGGSAQDIDAAGQSFFNLATAGSGTKTLTNALDVNGTLTIGSGTTLSAGTNTINIAGTWTNSGTFTPGTGTVIFDGTTQSINNSGQAFNNLTIATASSTKTLAAALDVDGNLVINANATLDVSASNYNLNVARTFTNNGTLNPRSGTVIFDGGTNQTINGATNTTFNNITVNKANNSQATFGTDQSIAGVLTLTDGVFNPNAHFTMLSSPTRDARIAQLGATASIAATSMTVQRYLPNTSAGQEYRYLASPVTNATVFGWKDDFPITGTFTDPSTKPEWPQFPNLDVTFPTLYRYNEAIAGNPALNSRYESYPVNGTASTAATLTNGRGYTAYIRQTTPITIELIGVAASGNVPIVISNTTGGGVASDAGWNLIGNPYASPIHWNNVTRPAGVQTQIAFKDNTDNIGLGAGQYLYYTQGGAGIPGVFDGTIAAGQAFWVRNTAANTSPTLTFQEDDKQPVNSPPFIREAIQDMLRVNVASTTSADELLIGFNQNAADGADVDFDAYKLKNQYINFSSLSTDNNEMAINILGPLTCSKQIPLHLNTVTVGGHTFTFSQIDSFDENIEIRLLDTFTSETINITEENSTYEFQVTSDPNSFGNNRFKIFIGYPTVDLTVGVEAMNICQGNDANIKIQAPQAGVVYYATLNGNTISPEMVATAAADLTLSIPKSNLTTNENHIVLMARSAGCTAVPLNNSATISIESIPGVSGVTNDARCGEGQVTLKASGAPANGGYNWYLTEDATDAIAGESASSFVTPVLTKTKTYFVAAVNSLGCEGGRMAVTATITYPYDIVGVTGAEACSGSSMNLSATGAPADGSYHWYVNQGGSEPVPGQSGATFTTPELTASTTYYVAAVNAAGCEGARVPVTAAITVLEDATITVAGNTLTSGATTGNQWYLNGNIIPGATSKTYVASESGVYKLVVTSGTCSTQVEREFAVTGDINDGLNGYVLYPNPSAGMIYVEVATPDAVTVSVKNTLGAEVAGAELKQDGEMRKGQLDISGHANGMYMVVIKHGDKTVIKKIVKN